MKYEYIIPIGDHCATSILLKELQIRNFSYPFDWTVHIDQLNETNINIHIDLLEELINTKDFCSITSKYIGLKNEIQNNIFNSIWFAHDLFNGETYEDMIEKYKRRFIRLFEHITSEKKIYFILITRKGFIKQESLDKLKNIILSFNKESKILIFSGNEQQKNILENLDKNTFIFDFYPYNSENLHEYDTDIFRPKLLDFFKLYLL
jgi:hypothetical protein